MPRLACAAAALTLLATCPASAQFGAAPPKPALMVGDKLAVVEGSWKPTAAEAQRAQATLKTYIDQEAVPSQWEDKTPESPGETRLRRSAAAKFDSYFIRATGITGRQDELSAKIDNKPMIRLDGFCKITSDVWKEAAFVINEGGGDCYFHAEYDLAGKAIVYFEVNRPSS